MNEDLLAVVILTLAILVLDAFALLFGMDSRTGSDADRHVLTV